ncbi:hypothetical protein KXQ82_05685 [Mucilaginibacter sp. HMF5004]|uniref:hypothetical protein n=1 Tax=Mucilaginibacter rivuli TaxID=2857527 RepID=UPI001C605D98|nr:hypothetical protein [Mucilaginibacter rivuli]MBW4889194.1 hypothetical protein [Mucilaginibacter rivuli]
MESNQISEEQEYVDAFNLGNILSKYSPEIGDFILGLNFKGSQLKAVQDGVKLSIDKEKAQATPKPSFLKNDRFSNNDADKELQSGKNIEPEK